MPAKRSTRLEDGRESTKRPTKDVDAGAGDNKQVFNPEEKSSK